MTNRLLPAQFGVGLDVSATRIDQCLRELVALYNNVPADLVQRRWSPSSLTWGFAPPNLAVTRREPFLSSINDLANTSPLEPPPSVADVWTVTPGGNILLNDVAKITIRSTSYTYTVTAGVLDRWDCTVGGVPAAAGDTFRLTVGTAVYDFVSAGAGAAADAAGIQAAAAADPLYNVTNAGPTVTLIAKADGPPNTVLCSLIVDPGADTTFTAVHTTTGKDVPGPAQVVAGLAAAAAADPLYTPSASGSTLTLTQITHAAVNYNISAEFTTGAGTMTVAHTATGTSPLFTNPQRVKSCAVATIDPSGTGGLLMTWEVSFTSSRPTILGGLTCMAEWAATGPYTNPWQYLATPPPGFAAGDPTVDFTLQACISDGWDLENRKKLRQESLVWRMRSDAFATYPVLPVPADTLTPTHPVGNFQGFAVHASPLVLVPAGARVRLQWTIPIYPNNTTATWQAFTNPARGNVWSLLANLWQPCR